MSDERWQALSNDIALHGYRGAKGQDATAALLAEKTALESQNQALQERAERAEALLRRISLYEDATHALIEVYFASRPTQETDPPDGSRLHGTVSHDPDGQTQTLTTRPTQETEG